MELSRKDGRKERWREGRKEGKDGRKERTDGRKEGGKE
jgi:hypothetical protein